MYSKFTRFVALLCAVMMLMSGTTEVMEAEIQGRRSAQVNSVNTNGAAAEAVFEPQRSFDMQNSGSGSVLNLQEKDAALELREAGHGPNFQTMALEQKIHDEVKYELEFEAADAPVFSSPSSAASGKNPQLSAAAARASLPSGKDFSIVGTTLKMDHSNGVITLKGSGTVPATLFSAYGDSIRQINITGNVVIGEGAFAYLPKLTTVNITSTGSSIGAAAFLGCSALTNVSISSSVTRLEEGAFHSCTSLESITLPSSVQYIGNYAFYSCTALTGFSAPGVKEFGAGVFASCTALTNFVMPETLTVTGGDTFHKCTALETVELSPVLTRIGEYDFYECSMLREIRMPDCVTGIGEGAFYYCYALENIDFPDAYVDVGSYAFSFCNNASTVSKAIKLRNIGAQAFIATSIPGKIIFSADTTDIGAAAFQGCQSLNSVDFQNASLAVDSNAFFDCPNLREIINPPTYTAVGEAAFHRCAGIESVTFSDDCTQIGSGCFFECSNLKSIDFRNSSAVIGTAAFYHCPALEKVSLSNKCTAIGSSAFYQCTALSEVDFSGAALELSDHVFTFCESLAEIKNEEAVTGIGAYAFCRTALEDVSGFDSVAAIGESAFSHCGKLKAAVIPEQMTAVPEYLFFGCGKLSQLTLPSAVQEIGPFAFTMCSSLELSKLPDQLTRIGKGAFAECDAFTNLQLPETLLTIEDHGFSQCDNLKMLSGGENVRSIGLQAFSWCVTLTAADFPGAVSVGEHAFNCCKSLETVTLSDQLASLENGLFAQCGALASFAVPQAVKTIGNSAFYQCESLEAVTLPQGVECIDVAAFYECTALKEIDIPDTVHTIGASCFKDCGSLARVSLPEGLESIADGVFYNCKLLADIEMPRLLKEIGYSSFFGCESLKTVELAQVLTKIGPYAFACCKNLQDAELPKTVQAVGMYAFAFCEKLISAVLPVRISEISQYLFYECDALEEVRCYGNIVSIGTGAFYNCRSLKNLYLYGGTPALIGDQSFSGVSEDLTLYSNALNHDWTVPEWTGPDGRVYHTEKIEPEVSGVFAEGLQWNYYLESGSLEISGSGRMEDYASEADTPWYSYINDIHSVHIDDGVTYIGERAFANCALLRSVYMEDSVTEFGAYAFAKCENLAYIDLSQKLDHIGSYVFYNCRNLSDLTLPLNMTKIGQYAFYGCSSIQGITIPDAVKELGEGAFYNCTGLRTVGLIAEISAVADYTFKGCSELTEVFLGSTISRIGKSAFADCEKLACVCISGKGAEIEDYAFSQCSELDTLLFTAEKPKTLGYRSFYGTPDDFAVEVPQGTEAGSALETKDGGRIACKNSTPAAAGSCGENAAWSFWDETGILFIEGTGSIDDCAENLTPWKQVHDEIRYVVISDGITSIGSNAFAHCSALQKIELPNGLTHIGESAFADCVSLQYAQLPDALVTLGKNVFYGCESLSGVRIPGSLTNIPEYGFAMCSRLAEAEIGHGITSISYSAFYGCSNLQEIQLPDTVTEIQSWAFARCTKLARMAAPKVTVLGEHSFFACENLSEAVALQNLSAVPAYCFAGTGVTEVRMPESIESVGEGAFWGCAQLQALDLGCVRRIEKMAFSETALRSVTIPDQTEEIGAYAFGQCSLLKGFSVAANNAVFAAEDGILYGDNGELLVQYPIGKQEASFTVPAHVKKIGTGAFCGSKLISIRIDENTQEVEAAAFANCSQLTKITIPGSVTAVPENAFRNCSALETVRFGGSAPVQIGECAFSATADHLKFVVSETEMGWTFPQWTGPDGVDYTVEAVQNAAYVLTAGDPVYQETSGGLECAVSVSNNTQEDVNAELWVSVYQGNKLLLTEKKAAWLKAQTSYETGYRITGGIADAGDLSVKVFLLEADTHIPLTASVDIPCRHTLNGEAPLCAEIFPLNVSDAELSQGTSFTPPVTQASAPAALSVDMQFSIQDFDRLIGQTARDSVAEVNFSLRYVTEDKTVSKGYSTDIDFAGVDSFFGYAASGVTVQNPGMTYELRQEGGMPLAYSSVYVSAENLRAVDLETAEPSNITISNQNAGVNAVDIQSDGKKLMSLRAMGYAAADAEAASEWYEDGTFAFVAPYNGMNLLVHLEPEALVDALNRSEAVKDFSASLCVYNLALCVADETGTPVTLGSVEITMDAQSGAVQNVSLREKSPLWENAADRTYNPLRYDESIEATENMAAEVNSISPSRGSNGIVTVKLEGTCLEAGIQVYLTGQAATIPAEMIYYFDHSKLYATFDLSDAADGDYRLTVDQQRDAVCTQTFTVDSSLPKGELSASINVDKSVKPGSEYKGSITYTNTGYTDVYAPVVLIDSGNIEIKGEESDAFTCQETVFVSNEEGLAGIIANGETAAYNFTYKVKKSDGFVMNVYNYADMTENVADPIVLTEKSTGADILNYNIFSLTGIRACDYAASVAQMACVQDALGEDTLEQENLHSGYISAAQGTLAGDTLVESTDIASRDLTLNRYYYSDVTSRNSEGLWGPGWFSEYDITAEYITAEGDAQSSIVLKNAAGMAVYTLKDGVYTEVIYGLSTAVNTENGITVSYEDGSTVSFNSSGKPCSISTPHANTTSLLYDADGALTEIRSDTGDSLIFAYTDGRLSSVRSSVTGEQVEYHYADDMLIGVIDAFDKVVYSYEDQADAGRQRALVKITSQTGAYQTFAYDELGRVTAISDSEGTTTYDYAGGCVLKVTSPMGDVSNLYFNRAGKLVRAVDAAGNVVESQYSDMLLNSSDSFGLFNRVAYEYDDKYNLTRITDAEGNSITYDHDSMGNVTKVTDRAGLATSYEHNALGDVQKMVYADGRYESFAYDAKGNVTSAVKRDGTTISFTYDEYSQLTEVAYGTGETIRYTYDDRGNITQIVENGAATKMYYGQRGELTRIEYADGKAIAYTYDSFGRMTRTDSTYGGVQISHFYEYDAKNRLVEVHLGVEDLVIYEYNADDSIKRQTNYNGTYTDYLYEAGYLKEIRNCQADGTVISFFRYTYDDLGNISTMTDSSGTWSYGYDKLGQLTRAVSPKGETTVYTYDLSGNRTSVVTEGSMVNYSSNAMNQYTTAGSAQLQYDDNGNLISRTDETGVTQYVYDYLDRLVEVRQPDGTVTAYTYDAFGGRNSVTVNGETMQYLNTPTGEGYPLVSFSATSVDTIYIQGNGMAGQARYDAETGALPYYAFAYNHLGSTTEITDGNGTVVNRYTYDEAGRVTDSVEGIENDLTYVGKYGITDDGNGLYYARARYISADTMSFTSMDPIGQNGGLNVYRYAGNNPVNYVDVTGENPLIAAAARVVAQQVAKQVAKQAVKKGGQQLFAQTTRQTSAQAVRRTGTNAVHPSEWSMPTWEQVKAWAASFWKGGKKQIEIEKRSKKLDLLGNNKYSDYYGLQDGDLIASANIGDVLNDTVYDVNPTYVSEAVYRNGIESTVQIDNMIYNCEVQTGIPAMTEGLMKYMQANNLQFDDSYFTILNSTDNSLVLGPKDFYTPGSEWGGLAGLLGGLFGWF